MKKGFTILELLVASLLLGMLMTILTMIFNQSSIAWRTGVAGVADLDDTRSNMAILREEADNIYLWSQEYRLVGLWGKDGELRKRAISGPGTEGYDESVDRLTMIRNLSQESKLQDIGLLLVGYGDRAKHKLDTYSVNVMCVGPDKEFDTWDDIWSYPDDFE